MDEFTVTPTQFRTYVDSLNDEQLAAFLDEIIPMMAILDEDDFFGPEGIQ